MFDSGASLEIVSTGPVEGFAPQSAAGLVKQRTLKNSIGCSGVGLHSGAKVTMVLHPAEANSGIVFRRTDINGNGAIIPAHWAAVNDTRLNTCIADSQGIGVRTIEHLMAALSGMGIDNALIDISGPEVPVMDGSAAPFLFLIECAGVVEQASPRRALKVLKPVAVRDGDKLAMITPWSFPAMARRFSTRTACATKTNSSATRPSTRSATSIWPVRRSWAPSTASAAAMP